MYGAGSDERSPKGNYASYFLVSVDYDGKNYNFTKYHCKRFNNSYELVKCDALYSSNEKIKGAPSVEGSPASEKAYLSPTGSGTPTMSVVDYLENVKDIFNDILPVDVLEHFGKQRRKTHYSDYLQANFDIDGESGDDYEGSLDEWGVFDEEDAMKLGREETFTEWQQRMDAEMELNDDILSGAENMVTDPSHREGETVRGHKFFGNNKTVFEHDLHDIAEVREFITDLKYRYSFFVCQKTVMTISLLCIDD